MKNTYEKNPEFILDLFDLDILIIEENPVRISNRGRVLKPTINFRKRSNRGDPRVDIWHKGKRKSINVSHLVWMYHTRTTLPPGFEIHHIDENPENNNFSNLICVHCLDHLKLHPSPEIPF